MTELNNRIVVGKLGSCYGVKGWLRVNSFTEQSENIFDYAPWYIQQGGRWSELSIESWRLHNQDYIVKLKQINDRDAAALLVNQELYVELDCLPNLLEGDYYWKDLIGCSVVTTQGYCLGKVIDLMETGSNDVLVVQAQPNDAYSMKERLIPFIEQSVIKQINLEQQHIKVEWDPAF